MINQNIQILRGVSLLFVLMFHLEVPFSKFGYLGVDIFFLISGFLMPIILPKYSAWEFIKARTQRLYPALAVVVFLSLFLGYFLLLPGEYINLAYSSLSSLTFVSQFYFFFHTGYFDQAAIYQPLLHTWSLGNEFLAYILIFISLLLFPRSKVHIFAYAVLIISFIYILVGVSGFNISYLDTIPRLFLFFCAFLVSLNKENLKVSDGHLALISILSLTLIIVFFNESILLKSWPNYGILFLPTAFVPLMLMGQSITPFSWLNKVLSKIGDWSYSIYIWHWPVIAFERIYLRNAFISPKEIIALLFISVALGCFSYYYIERNKVLGKIFGCLSVLSIVAIILSEGALYRTPKSLSKYSSIEIMTDRDNYISKEKLNGFDIFKVTHGENKFSTIVIGDSHSQHILPVLKSGEYGILYRLEVQPYKLYKKWLDLKKTLITLEVKKIIFTYRLHTKDLNHISLIIDAMNEASFSQSFNISILRDIPSFNGDPVACLFSNESDLLFKSCGFDIKKGLPIEKVYNRDNPVWDIIKKNSNARIQLIDTHDKMCDDRGCVMKINNDFVLRDSNHFNEKMSDSTNKYLFRLLFK